MPKHAPAAVVDVFLTGSSAPQEMVDVHPNKDFWGRKEPRFGAAALSLDELLQYNEDDSKVWGLHLQDVKWQPLSVRVWGCRIYRLGFMVYRRGLYSNKFSRGMQWWV